MVPINLLVQARGISDLGQRSPVTLERCRMSSVWCGKWSYAGVGLKSLPGVVTDQPYRTGALAIMREGNAEVRNLCPW